MAKYPALEDWRLAMETSPLDAGAAKLPLTRASDPSRRDVKRIVVLEWEEQG